MPYLLLLCLLSIPLGARDSTLIEFRLKDQFDSRYSQESWPGKVIVLIGSDRGGSQYNGAWGSALHDSLQAHAGYRNLQFVGLSDLRGVPFFMKGFVRGKFPKEPESWVLMDRKGIFPKAYQFEPDASNILVFNREEICVHQTAVHELDNRVLDRLLEIMRPLLIAEDSP